MRIKEYLLLVLLTWQTLSFSQTKHFQHITNADGISQSEVYTFLEDSRGFMWFGTVDGLNQYDGYDIKIFNTDKNNPNSISNNTIRSLAEDNFGRIWIGTDDGLSVYSPTSEKIYQVKIGCVKDGLLLPVRSIIIDKNYLLLGTSSGLLRTNINTTDLNLIEKEFQWVKFSNDYRLNIFDVIKRRDGSIWMITATNLLGMVFQNETPSPLMIENVKNDNFKNNLALKEDKFGNLWIITHNNGFTRYNPSTKRLNFFNKNLSNQTVVSNMYSDVTTDKDGNLWIASRDKGLIFLKASGLNDENPQFENIQHIPFDEKSLNSNLIYSLYVSSDNLLWIGTIGSGINIYDSQQKEFNLYKIPFDQSSSNFIRSVFADTEDNIWLGTHNNGLYIFNRGKNTFHKVGFDNESVFFICDVGGGNKVVCTSEGVSVVKLANYSIKKISEIYQDAHFFACKSKDDIVWLAGLNGITKGRLINGNIKAEKVYNSNSSPRISFNNCRVLYYDKGKNELLAGTEGGGLNILKLNSNHDVVSISVYKKNNSPGSISNNYIRSITKDSNGDIWIGTYEGLNKVLHTSGSNQLTFKNYTKTDGLPNNMIQAIVEDNQKNLWIGTNGGLCCFDLKNEQIINFSASEGLQNNEFSEHTAFKKPDGEIIMGGINGINIFYPRNIRPNGSSPKTTITGFYLFNNKVNIIEGKKRHATLSKSIVLTDTILLASDQTSFGFDFSAMLHSNPGKVKYAYMLKGFDKDWNYTDAKNRHANYTNLRYGNYIFMVKSTNIDGKWEENPRQIFIHIKTPFAYTKFAFVIYFILIVLIFIYFTNYSVIKYTTKKKMYLDNVHNKKMHELDELKSRFFINISHDLRTPLTLISSPLELVLKNKDLQPEVKNHLNLMHRNVKKLRYITEQLLDFSKAEAGKLQAKRQYQDIILFIKNEASHFTQAIKSKGLEFFIVNTEESMFTGFDPDMISKVFFNLVSNAIKHTQNGEIVVRVERVSQGLPEALLKSKHQSFIKIDIKDSGEGIEKQDLERIFDRFYQGKSNAEKGYGIGLSHCKDLIEALEGHIEATSALGVGTTFHIYIPDVKSEKKPQKTESFEINTDDIYVESIHDIAAPETTTDDDADVKKILLIDDNPEMRKFISQELSKEYKVYEAEDGSIGLELAVKILPDLIVSDIMMPKIDGLEFCKKIKSDIETSHIPVILLTAKADTETRYEGIEIGADDYISKPFEMEYLVLRIKNLLKSREQLRRLFYINNSLDPSAVTVTSLDEKFLSQLMTAMENGIPDPNFSVNSLESTMGMSHSNFYRKIKTLTGQSGKDILLSMRMKRARQILSDNPGIRISDVAYMVGYTNPKYFSQIFKEFYGVLPSDILPAAK